MAQSSASATKKPPYEAVFWYSARYAKDLKIFGIIPLLNMKRANP